MSNRPTPGWLREKIAREQEARRRAAALGLPPPASPSRREIHDRLEAIVKANEERNERNPPPF